MITPKKYKLARRLGAPIFEKCQNAKFSLAKPGAGKSRPKRTTDYGQQLIEKQKVRFYYNVSEKQFARYVNQSLKSNHPSRVLFELLESRLDSVALRAGFAPTRFAARQLVGHGHLLVNGRRVDVPSFSARPGDVVSFREGTKTSRLYTDTVDRLSAYTAPGWIKVDPIKVTATVSGVPVNPDPMLNFQSVVEFYSR